ncbi:MAG: glycogen synthase [Nitrospiraceae bacterium]|nr:glycogen synthase [Nitrospiraceae bacterium]
MNIAVVASEAFPFSKTGGLADVAGALWKQFSSKGHESLLITPLYTQTKTYLAGKLPPVYKKIILPVGSTNLPCNIRIFGQGSGRALLIDNSELFFRDDLYGTGGKDYPDNDRRYAFFCRAALQAMKEIGFSPDIIQCNDWQTSLIPLQLKTVFSNDAAFSATATVFTVHNLGYQGIFPATSLAKTGLPDSFFNPAGVEFYENINFLKAGIIGADAVTTVSRNYANEILAPEKGFGLDGVLRDRLADFYGIPNGIDYDLWDPQLDPLLPSKYSAKNLSGKTACKKALIEKCGFSIQQREPLFTFVGRLAAQKGIELIIGAADKIVNMGCIAIVGKGDLKYQANLTALQKKYPERLRFFSGFDEPTAHLAYAGADMFIMPSLYEPCGLGQMIAMRYGTVPVARSTGGLADTIESAEHLISESAEIDNTGKRGTGFLFNDFSAAALTETLFTAALAFQIPEVWSRLIANSMKKDFSWSKSANIYLELFNQYKKNPKT